MAKIAFLGLGAMGSRIARSLANAGHDLTVYSRTPSRADALASTGASVAKTPRDAATGADVVFSMVTDDEASRAMWLTEDTGALAGIEPGSLAIESSTLTTGWVTSLAAAVADRGGEFVDAPVVGSTPQADAAALVYLIGGTAHGYTRAREVCRASATALHHVGPVGHGMLLKLVVNAYFATQVAVLAELLGVARLNGLSLESALPIFSSLPVTSRALQGITRQIATAAFSPLFPIDLVAKDLGYLVELGVNNGAGLDVTRAAKEMYEQARRVGLGGLNISGVSRLFELNS